MKFFNGKAILQVMYTAVFLVGSILFVGTLHAEDWPQWRGEGRMAVWQETGVLETFPETGLKVAWRAPVRSGFAGPVVSNGKVFVLDWQEDPESRTMDGTERLVALDEETGAELWITNGLRATGCSRFPMPLVRVRLPPWMAIVSMLLVLLVYYGAWTLNPVS